MSPAKKFWWWSCVPIAGAAGSSGSRRAETIVLPGCLVKATRNATYLVQVHPANVLLRDDAHRFFRGRVHDNDAPYVFVYQRGHDT